MSETLQQIQSLLTRLSVDEKKQVVGLCKELGLFEITTDEKDEPYSFLRTIYSISSTELLKHHYHSPPFSVFRSRKTYKLLLEAAPLIQKFINTHLPSLNRTEQQVFFHIMARSIIRFLKKRKLTISQRIFFQNLVQFERAIDECFPGYIASGLIMVIIKKEWLDVWEQSNHETGSE